MADEGAVRGSTRGTGQDASRPRVERLLLLGILTIQLVLVSPSLMPPYPEINPFDEAKYVISGSQLLNFQIRDLAHGPFVAVVYAPLHLIFGASSDWFVLETWAGRVLLFLFLSLCTLHLGNRLRRYVSPYVLAGVLFATVPFLYVVTNQSDALFAGLSALILARLLKFHADHERRDLIIGSALVGAAVMTRAEAVTLLAIYPGLALIVSHRRTSLVHSFLQSTLPAIGVLSIYLLLLSWSTGSTDLGFRGKSYNSFELSQPVSAGMSPREETARLYGTAEENNRSVLRAILRNPSAFAQRLWVRSLIVPKNYLDYFERRQGPVLLILALWGFLRMLRARRWKELAAISVWSLEPWSAVPFVTSHIVAQLSQIVLLFSAVGIVEVTEHSASSSRRVLSIGGFLALALAGLISNKLALLAGGVVVLAGLLLIYGVQRSSDAPSRWTSAPLLILLAAGIILRTPYPFPNYASLGATSEEQAVHFLEDALPPGSLILSPVPGPAVAARMLDIGPGDVPDDARASDTFIDWIQDRGIEAVYLDSRLRGSEEVYATADELAGSELRVAFTTPDQRIRILLPVP
jgi:hypothetical protein